MDFPTATRQAIESAKFFVDDTGHEKHIALGGIVSYPDFVHFLLMSDDKDLVEKGRKFMSTCASRSPGVSRAIHTIVGKSVEPPVLTFSTMLGASGPPELTPTNVMQVGGFQKPTIQKVPALEPRTPPAQQKVREGVEGKR